MSSFTEPGRFDCGDKKSLNSFCMAIGDASVNEGWRGGNKHEQVILPEILCDAVERPLDLR